MHSFYNLQKKEKSRADLTQHVTWKLFLLLLCHCHNNSIHAQFPFCVYVIILNGNFFDDRKKNEKLINTLMQLRVFLLYTHIYIKLIVSIKNPLMLFRKDDINDIKWRKEFDCDVIDLTMFTIRDVTSISSYYIV